MPIFEYLCRTCGNEFEELVAAAHDQNDVRCPNCRKTTVDRKLSLFAARQGATSQVASTMGGCGRCGDPNGPCAQ